MIFDPVWEKIHSERQWLSVPQEEMVFWVGNYYINGKYTESIRVLDIGCGQGASTFFLAVNKLKVTALDGSASALKKLEQSLKEQNLRADLVCGEMSKMAFPDGYFDAVIDIASICMNENCKEIYDEVARVLKPGGGLFSVVPSTDSDKTLFLGKGPITFFEPNQIKLCLMDNFHMSINYKCVEPEDKSKRVSHWLIVAVRK